MAEPCLAARVKGACGFVGSGVLDLGLFGGLGFRVQVLGIGLCFFYLRAFSLGFQMASSPSTYLSQAFR